MPPVPAPMKFGIFTGPQNVGWDELREVWELADRSGFDSGFVWDHLVPLFGSLDQHQLEGWTVLSALAMRTDNLEVGHLVLANTFRHPALLSKMATTLDHATGGRLVLGIGTGYYPAEHESYGLPLPSKKERAEMLSESLEILRGMWEPGRFTFDGAHYSVKDAAAEPPPVQSPRPPILLGGAGERLMRNVARYADRWDLPDGQAGVTPDHFRMKWERVKALCDEIGRDASELETSTSLVPVIGDEAEVSRRKAELQQRIGWDDGQLDRHTLAGTPEQVVEELHAWREAGVDQMLLSLWPGFNYGEPEVFAETVLPHVRAG
jgi:alkanesulfonate monooxygenase SsuD/methylene tetrahydromethanopterin reductase-like flavin-dependent oxidoreductase (luciferase family)